MATEETLEAGRFEKKKKMRTIDENFLNPD